MKIENSNIKDHIEDIHVSKYGVYYFFKDFVIGEIHQGVIYTWESAQDIIIAAHDHYGGNPNICYITNRVNKYSIKPTDWLKFFSTKNNLNGYAIVSYSKNGWMNALIEKMFLKTKFERFSNLLDAIEWAKDVNLKSISVEVSPI